MKEGVGKILKVIVAIVGAVIGVLIWIEIIPSPFEWREIPVGLVGLFTAVIYYFIDLLMKKKRLTEKNVSVVQHEKNPTAVIGDRVIYNDTEPLIKELVKQTEAKMLAENEAVIWKENYNKLQAEYTNRDNLSDYKQHALELRHKGKIEEAIESIDTNAADEEAANRHIFKAELLIDNFQFDEAEKHYKQAVTIFPSYDSCYTIASFYYNLNKFHEGIEYYKHCLNLADIPENKAAILNDMGNAQLNNTDFTKAEASYQEALKIYRQLAKENPNAYLPKVAMTLNNLAMFYQDDVPNKKLSLKYANETVEALDKCNNTPFVREQLEKAKWVIEKWNNK